MQGPQLIHLKLILNCLGKISNEIDAYLLVDMAHYSGLIAGKCYPDPLPFADVCTSTTHKTLRGPRGGIIVSNNEELGKKIAMNDIKKQLVSNFNIIFNK